MEKFEWTFAGEQIEVWSLKNILKSFDLKDSNFIETNFSILIFLIDHLTDELTPKASQSQ